MIKVHWHIKVLQIEGRKTEESYINLIFLYSPKSKCNSIYTIYTIYTIESAFYQGVQ